MLFSQRSPVRFNVMPLKVVVPSFTNCATPASCSGVEMSNDVSVASYHVMSAVPSQIVCADNGAAKKPNVKIVSIKNRSFFIILNLMNIDC